MSRLFLLCLGLRLLNRECEAGLLASGGIRLDHPALLRLINSGIRLREERLCRLHVLPRERLGKRLGRILHRVLAAQVKDVLAAGRADSLLG